MTNVQDPGALSTSGDHEPLVYLADGNLLTLQDSVDLLRTSFERIGDDLVLGNADRPALVILDYFTPGNASDLATDGGAVLPARVVAKLAGPDPAQDAPSSNQTVIGHVETVSGEVIITRADGSQVVATVGTPVFEDDVVVTADGGAIGLRFIDGMTLSLGSDARMVLDEFAYNPEANEGGGIIEIIQGAFSFVSGAAARMGLDSLVIDTPTMTIGIRGTKVVANASAEGETTDVVLLPEDDGTIGKIMIKTDAGEELLETAFSATSVTSRLLPPAPQTEVTPDWVYAYFSDPIAALPNPTIDDDGPTINRPDVGLGLDIETTINTRPRGTIERIDDQPSNQRIADNERGTEPVEPSPSPTTSASDETRNDPTPITVQEEPTSDEADLTDEPEFGGFDADKLLVEDATPENNSPTVISPINNTGTDEDAVFSYDIAGSFTDDDLVRGDSLTFNAAQSDGTALPAWLTIDPTGGVLSGTPSNDDVGTLSLIVTATDEAGASVSTTFQLTVDNINDQPVVSTSIADATPTEDLLFTYDVSGNFADDDTLHGDSLTFGATLSDGTVLPAWLSIDATTGILSGTPDTTDVGVAYTIAVTATDASGSHVTATFQVTVSNTNDAPTVSTPINDTNAAEDAAFSYDISGNFADDDIAHGDSLTFSAEQNGGAPLPAWLAIDPSTGVLSGTPDNDDVGTITVAVTATDDAGAAVTNNFQLTVDNTNDIPVVVTTISDTSTAEDAAFSYDVSSNFTDDDLTHGDSLTFSAEQNGGAPLPAWLAIDPSTGVLSGTPDNDDVGTITVAVTATDDAGAAVTNNFQLTVDNTNDTPVVVTTISDTSTAEDAAFSYDVSGNFTDDDLTHGDSLTFSATQSNGAPIPAWLSMDPTTGVLSGTPTNDDVSVITLTVIATDDAGVSTATNFQLTVDNINDQPVVVTPIADAAPSEDAPFTYDVSGNFRDDDTVHGDSLTFSAEQSGGTPLPGWLSIDPTTGILSGTPDSTQVGIPYTIEVTATDASGANITSTFQLTVNNVNDAPVLDVTATPTMTAVAANATDPAGDTIASLIADGSITDADGSAVEAIALTGVDDTSGTWQFSINDGSSWTDVGAVADDSAILLDGTAMLRFIPDQGFGGSATFTFRAWDQTTGSNGQTGVDASNNGGTTAFSADNDTGSVSVQGTTPDLSSGSEFKVNTTTAGEQTTPSIAALSDGGFVVTWQSRDQDGDNWGIYGQRFDNAGTATGSEFLINSTTADAQENPSVAGLEGGGFVVVWNSHNQDGDNDGIYGQRFDSSGSAVGGEFLVNTYTTQRQEMPSITALNDGGFVVTWESRDQDGDGDGIFGQRYDSAGSTVGSEFQINTSTDDPQEEPSITALADGGFVVVWESNNQDGDKEGIYGQRYGSAGATVGSEFQINTTTADDQEQPAVAALDDGGFVVVWESRNQDGDVEGIYGQRYDSSGNAIEFEFQINQETTDQQREPAVAALKDGGFIVTWHSKDQDGDNWGVYGRRYNADGDPLGDEFQINTTTTDEQRDVTVATLEDGGVAVAWQSRGQDGDNWGVYGHRYDNETASVTVNPPVAEAASTLDFSGTDSYVDAGDPGQNANDLDPGRGDYTVEAWFYYDGANGRQTIVSKGNDDALDAGFNIFLDDDQLVVRASTDGGLDGAAMKVTLSGSPGWHHVAMVLDQESGSAGSSIRGYLDGSDAGWSTGHGIIFTSTVTTSDSRQITTDERFLIGAADKNGTAEDFFTAEIADVRVWNTARSQAEIQADLGRTLNGDEPHLLANWQLDDGSGTTASDATGAHDGTLTGSPSWQDALNLTTALDTALAGRLSASDLEGDQLAYSVLTNGGNGTAAIDADNGTWTYDPDAGFSGADSFSYQITDGNGGVDTVTIAVTVTP